MTRRNQRGRYTLGEGAVLHDGARTVMVRGFGRDGTGALTVEIEADGVLERIAFAELCRNTSTLVPLSLAPEHEPTSPDWIALPEEARRQALQAARHLRQVLTGSPDGNPERARLVGVVDARYDPERVELRDRIRAKSEELRAAGVRGFSEASIYRKLAGFSENGLLFLIDDRASKRVDPLTAVDPAVVDVARQVIADRASSAQLSARKLNALVRHAVEDAKLQAPARELNSVVRELTRGHAMHRTARSRSTHTNRPVGLQGRLIATRPGEVVQIDATPSNVHAWFPDYGWGPATILTAIDVYTRQIVALRVVPGALTTRDSALLLWDACRAEVSAAGWPWKLRRWHGMPTLVCIDSDQTRLPIEPDDKRRIGSKTALLPSMVVIDHGSEFDAEHFQSVCARNGIDVLFSRPRTPTDKGVVESWHYTLDQALRTVPGYKGANPMDHAAGVEGDAVLTCADLQDMLWAWILTVYHDTPHSGLRDQSQPAISVSPNMMFDRFVAVGGHIDVPRDPYCVIGFLSAEQRLVQDDGIHVHNRTYVSEDLLALRPRMQRGVGAPPRALTVYYDRWDLSRVFLKHPTEQRWVCVPMAVPGGAAVSPFSDALARHAMREHLRGTRPASTDELIAREQQLLANWNAGEYADRRDRRIAALEHERQTSYARDIADWSQEMRDLAFPPRPIESEGLVGYEDADLDDAEVFDYADDDVDGLAL